MAAQKKKIRVLLACAEDGFRGLAADALRAMREVELAAVVSDGVQAQRAAEQYHPALAIIDSDLTLCDGMTVIRSIRKTDREMGLVLLATFIGLDLGAQCRVCNVANVLVKPVLASTLCEQVLAWESGRKLLQSDRLTAARRRRIARVLHHIGMPKSIQGYYYIINGVVLILENGEQSFSVTKWLYPKLAAMNRQGATPGSVERDIRYAIETTWTRTELAALERWFGPLSRTRGDHPTNSEFLSALAGLIRDGEDMGMDGQED